MTKRSLKDLGKSSKSKNICACFATRKAARSITQFYKNYMSDSLIGSSQRSLLMIAYLAEKIAITKMAEFAVMDRTTLTRNLKPLKEQGLININPGEDRRERIIIITVKGIKYLKATMSKWEKAQMDIEKKLGSKKFDEFINMLNEVMDLTKM